MSKLTGDTELLSISEAADLLNVSRPTFAKIRVESGLDSIAVKIGKRVRFPKNKLLEILKKATLSEAPKSVESSDKKLCIFSDLNFQDFDFDGSEIDLTDIRVIDPFGTLSLLVLLINRSRAGEKVFLKIDKSIICRHLRRIYFFDMLEMFAENITWDREVLKGDNYIASDNLMPITVVRHKGAERTTVQKLIELLGVHGFSSDRSGHLGGVLGELADNCMTHSHEFISGRMCFLQAQRHAFGEKSHCLIVAIADVGTGIAESLKRNSQHQSLSDEEAVLSAFKYRFSSWPKEAKRGKGLTDALGMTMGNSGVLRVASNYHDFGFKFKKGPENSFRKFDPPLLRTDGTRIGIFYIDHEFNKISRSNISDYIDGVLEKL